MSINPGIIFSNSELEYKNRIIENIKKGNNVYINCPGGMYRRTILKEIEKDKSLNEKYSIVYFNLEDENIEGAHKFYERVLQKVYEKNKKCDSSPSIQLPDFDLTTKYIQELEKLINQPTIIIFNNIAMLKKYFLLNFLQHCNSIYKKRNKNNFKSNFKNLIMIFGSSISNKYEKILIKISERIIIKPIPDNERNDLILNHLKKCKIIKPSQSLIDKINHITEGYHHLIVAIIRFILTKKLENFNETKIIEPFINYVFEILSSNNEKLDQNELIIKKNFERIIEHIQSVPRAFEVIINYLNGIKLTGDPRQNYDDVTITGCFKKNNTGQYSPSNLIYEQFIIQLLIDHQRADYCLFHIKDKKYWDMAFSIYEGLEKQNVKRKKLITELFSINKISKLKLLFINYLKTLNKTEDIIFAFYKIIKYVLNINTIGIFHIKRGKSKIDRKSDSFYKIFSDIWITKDLKDNNRKFMESVFESQFPSLDWTGKFLAVPVYISSNFKKVVICKIENKQTHIYMEIAELINRTLTLYYYVSINERPVTKIRTLQDNYPDDNNTSYRSRFKMEKIWNWTRRLFPIINLNRCSFYEILSENRMIETTSNVEKLSQTINSLQKDNYLYEIYNQMKRKNDTFNVSKFEDNNVIYIAGLLNNNVVIVLKFYNDDKYIIDNIILCYQLFHYMINVTLSENELNLIKDSLLISDNYSYIISNGYEILFISDKLKNSIKNSQEQKCYKALMNNDNVCANCPVKNIFSSNDKTIKYLTQKIELNKKNRLLNYTFAPVWDNLQNQVVAISVKMYDITETDILLKSIENMQQQETIIDIEKVIIENFRKFGFSRVFQWGTKVNQKDIYISENYCGDIKDNDKGEKFINNEHVIEYYGDDDIRRGEIVVLYRPKYPNKDIVNTIRLRLKKTEFKFKIAKKIIEYDKTVKRPNLWVVVPLIDKYGVFKIYVLDNYGDEEKDKESITIENLKIIDTYRAISALILENTKKRYEYVDKLQAMLSHATKEPLQLMRMNIANILFTDDNKERKRLAGIADGSLEMVQTALGSLLALERNISYLKTKIINIVDLLHKQIRIFIEYANSSGIELNLIAEERSIRCQTDENILILILNNIIGNSIKYLQRYVVDFQKQIQIQLINENQSIIIRISDNGPGLPEAVIEYFKKPFYKEVPYPGGGLGIGFSRDMSNMINSDLKLALQNNPFKQGACFELHMEKNNESIL